MGTLNTAWSIVRSALETDQGALNIVAGNTANANTPGYSVKRPELAQADVLSLGGGGGVANGVALTGAVSQRDRVLNERVNQQTQQSYASAARLTALNDLQSVFAGALGTSGASASSDIGQSLTNFFNSLSHLSASPSDGSMRDGVLAAAQSLAESFNQAARTLSSQQASLDQTAVSLVDQVNSLAKDVANLNTKIAAISNDSDAGALEDQRQLDLTNLSRLVSIHQIRTEGDGLTVTTAGGAVLVQGGKSQVLDTSAGAVTHFSVGSQDITGDLSSGGGQLAGLLKVRDTDIPDALSQLDALAYAVGNAVNTANSAGTDANGSPGGIIFQVPPSASGSAGTIAVSLTDPAGIAAAGSGLGTADGSNSAAMGDIRSTALISGATPAEFYSACITHIGNLVSEVQAEVAAQQSSLSQLTAIQSALSSVNLNDEAASLESFEQSYQAASKVFSILNMVMASAINLGTPTAVN